MNLIRAVLNNRVKYATFLFLRLISATGVVVNAQDVSYNTQADSILAVLPNAPSPEFAFETNQPQSVSQPQSTPTKAPSPNYRPMKVREKLYLYDPIGPGAFWVAGVQAGVDQSRTLKVPYPPDGFIGPGNHPAHGAIPEWGGRL